MRTKITLSIVMSVLVTALTGFAGNYIGTITSIEGTATVKDAAGSSSRLQLNAPVYLQDEVTTEAGAKLQITFEDGTVFSQGEKSVMVINEYVYSPTSKKNNKALFGMVKGVFRVVTDQITKLNPEGFGVDTNYGTIGIRGCDLAFVITENADNVFIVDLHTADSVVVNKDATASSAAQEMVIRSGGILVAMDEAGMSQQTFPATILNSILQETTPNSAAGSSETAAAAEGKSENVALADVVEQLVEEKTGIGVAGTFVQNTTASQATEEIAAELAANIPAETAAATPLAVTPITTPDSGDTGSVYPIVGPLNRQTVATGTDWSWGAWSQETTDLVDGTPVTSVAAGTFVNGNNLTKPDFDAIAGGATRYDLSGTGAAGAAITEGGNSSLVSGSALLNVSVGGGISPVWQGDFNMSGNGAALAFDAAGGIQDGRMTGNVAGYNLNTPNGSYGAPASGGVSGNLVGPGSGARPITGAAGQFDFDHGANGPKVQGVFGADLE